MFDTHCHLNFSAFKKKLDETITNAKSAGIEMIVIPGTDIVSSQKAVEIAESHEHIYAAVGTHPHHVYEMKIKGKDTEFKNELSILESLLSNEKVVAVGEVGIDRYMYTSTKYKDYVVDEEFVELQKKIFGKQIQLAIAHHKSLIIHNRLAKKDLFDVLEKEWHKSLEHKTVLHCCEPDPELLKFAQSRKIFLGIDGDVTYSKEKQDFIKKIGNEEFLSRYVLETDAPFLLPEPLRTQKLYPNKPQNIQTIAAFLAELLQIDIEIIKERTTQNARELFSL